MRVQDWLTRGLIVGTFAAWIAWDVYLAQHGFQTESMVMRDWAKHCTFFPHLIGFLCGHWFFPRRNLWASGWMWALPIWGALGLWDGAWALWVHTFPWYRFSLVWLLVGIPCGSYLWGQPDSDSPVP